MDDITSIGISDLSPLSSERAYSHIYSVKDRYSSAPQIANDRFKISSVISNVDTLGNELNSATQNLNSRIKELEQVRIDLQRDKELNIGNEQNLRSNTIQLQQNENHLNEANDQLSYLEEAKELLNNHTDDPAFDSPVNVTLKLLDLSRKSVIRRLHREIDDNNADFTTKVDSIKSSDNLNDNIRSILTTIDPNFDQEVQIPDLLSSYRNSKQNSSGFHFIS